MNLDGFSVIVGCFIGAFVIQFVLVITGVVAYVWIGHRKENSPVTAARNPMESADKRIAACEERLR